MYVYVSSVQISIRVIFFKFVLDFFISYSIDYLFQYDMYFVLKACYLMISICVL